MGLLHILDPNTKSSIDIDVPEKAIQPNAIDLMLDKVFQINSDTFLLTEGKKTMKTTTPIEAGWYAQDNEHLFLIQPRSSYEIVFQGVVDIGEGEAGWIIPRSTVVRNGLFITSGLYDSGYNGVLGAVLHNPTDSPAYLSQGVRLGQLLIISASSRGKYSGSYGLGSQHDQKYQG